MSFYKSDNDSYLKVEIDDYPENPRSFYEGLGTFYTFQRDKISPDKHSYGNVDEMLDDILGEGASDRAHENNYSIQDILKEFEKKGYVALAIYHYEHSCSLYQVGESNPFSCPWDSAPVGFAFVSEERMKKQGIDREGALEVLKGEMADYSAWANGEVYLVSTYDPFGEELEINMTYYGFDGIKSDFKNMDELEGIKTEDDLISHLIEDNPEKFVKSDKASHQMLAAGYEKLSPENLNLLSKSPFAKVRGKVASNRNTPTETLENLEHDDNRGVRGRAMVELDRREGSQKRDKKQLER